MTGLATVQPPRSAPGPASARAQAIRVGLVVWLALVAAGVAWGTIAIAGRPEVAVGAAPLVGRWRVPSGLGLLSALALAVVVVAAGPTLAARLPWHRVPLATGATATLWALALAASDGWYRVTAPLTTRFEYEPFAATVDDPLVFWRTFTERAADYPTHVKAHPPGATLVFWVLDRAGLGGAGWGAVLVLAAWGAATAAVVIALRAAAGEGPARRAAPVVAVVPAAVWAGTSADALFAGVVAAGGALVVVAGARRRHALAAAGGAMFGVALLLTHGAAPLLFVPVAVAAFLRRWRQLAVAGSAAVGVLALAAAFGFWWLDGLATTHELYWAGRARHRPAAYFALAGNPAALALSAGPAVAAGLATGLATLRQRAGRAVAVLPLAALVAVAAANASLLSKAEVERIWLPFVPWMALAAGALPGDTRRWVAATAGLGLVVQATLASPW